jgi:DNA-binding NtrC family response regulator
MERAVLLSIPPYIDEPNLSFPIQADSGLVTPPPPEPDVASYRESIREHARQREKQALVDALRQTGGNRSRAAKLLGIGRTSLYQKIKDLGLD